jgi:outer membrane protein OmpA-like peptidoglycan-associated protein
MKILLIGFLAFSAWSSFSTYIYVCRIKGLCGEPTSTIVETTSNTNSFAGDTLNSPKAQENVAYPGNHIVYFAFDKSEFNSDAATANYFNESKVYLDQNTHAKISITGHTDSVGSLEYNLALGFRRAKSLQLYFESKGIQPGKIILKSMGENVPADSNATVAGRANNRRTELTINK